MSTNHRGIYVGQKVGADLLRPPLQLDRSVLSILGIQRGDYETLVLRKELGYSVVVGLVGVGVSPIPDSSTSYSGKGSFVTTNTKVKGT